MKSSASALALLLVVVLTGCSPVAEASPSSTVAPTSTPSASTEASTPVELVPGSTLDRSAVTAAVPAGETISIVVPSDPGEEERLAFAAVQDAAARHRATVQVHADTDPVASVTTALADRPDVIVAIGPALISAIDRASAANLDVSFLVLGTQLAEPTGNVIAVTWPGAEERAVFADAPASFTGAATYAGEALGVGLAAFASGLDGHVIALD